MMATPYDSYTYTDYLAQWAELFGDVDSADFGWWRGKQRVPYIVHKLSEVEFQEHLTKLNQASDDFEVAAQAGNDIEMDNALSASFPHELALLI